MTGYYTLVDALRNHFDNDVLVNTVTNGDIFDVDIAKQTIFPTGAYNGYTGPV
jgi:hypothetical protein